MRYVVLDTDVASAAIKGSLSGPVAEQLIGVSWCVTFVTVGELWHWAEIRSWGPVAKDRLQAWLSDVVVIDSDEQISRTRGQLLAHARRRGRPRPVNDSWIAACCLSHDLPLATWNVKDYLDYRDHEGFVLLQSTSPS